MAATPRILGWRVATGTTWAQASRQDKAGRWHYAGSELVYVSSTPELAVLEALAHHRPGRSGYWLSRVMTRARLSDRMVRLDALGPDWRKHKRSSRRLGHRWLQEGDVPLLNVPSALCGLARNLLINPALVPPGSVWIEPVTRFRFDRRLVQR